MKNKTNFCQRCRSTQKKIWTVRRLCLLWFSQFWSHYFLSSDILFVAFGFKEWPIEGFHGCCFLGSFYGNWVQRHLLANSQKTNHNGIFLWNGLCRAVYMGELRKNTTSTGTITKKNPVTLAKVRLLVQKKIFMK